MRLVFRPEGEMLKETHLKDLNVWIDSRRIVVHQFFKKLVSARIETLSNC